MSIGHFPTRSSTAYELYLLLWKAISYLEITSGLKLHCAPKEVALLNRETTNIT